MMDDVDTTDLPTDLSEDVTDSLDYMEMKSAPQGTAQQTMQYSERFRSFLTEKKLPSHFEVIPDRYLCQYLRKKMDPISVHLLSSALEQPSTVI